MGRRAFQPTQRQREHVTASCHAGLPHAAIASALQVSISTLEKYFGNELRLGAAKKRVEVLVAMHLAAKRGKVGAMKRYLSVPAIRATGGGGQKT